MEAGGGLTDGVVDLGALPKGGGGGEPLVRVPGVAHYVNDCQVSFDGGGNVTLELFFKNNAGAHDPVTVTMPAPVFLEIAGLQEDIGMAYGGLLRRQSQQVEAAAAAMAEDRKPPTDLDSARAARDAG